MTRHCTDASGQWAEELARNEAELTRGERVPASTVHSDINLALAKLKAKAFCNPKAKPLAH